MSLLSPHHDQYARYIIRVLYRTPPWHSGIVSMQILLSYAGLWQMSIVVTATQALCDAYSSGYVWSAWKSCFMLPNSSQGGLRLVTIPSNGFNVQISDNAPHSAWTLVLAERKRHIWNAGRRHEKNRECENWFYLSMPTTNPPLPRRLCAWGHTVPGSPCL